MFKKLVEVINLDIGFKVYDVITDFYPSINIDTLVNSMRELQQQVTSTKIIDFFSYEDYTLVFAIIKYPQLLTRINNISVTIATILLNFYNENPNNLCNKEQFLKLLIPIASQVFSDIHNCSNVLQILSKHNYKCRRDKVFDKELIYKIFPIHILYNKNLWVSLLGKINEFWYLKPYKYLNNQYKREQLGLKYPIHKTTGQIKSYLSYLINISMNKIRLSKTPTLTEIYRTYGMIQGLNYALGDRFSHKIDHHYIDEVTIPLVEILFNGKSVIVDALESINIQCLQQTLDK